MILFLFSFPIFPPVHSKKKTPPQQTIDIICITVLNINLPWSNILQVEKGAKTKQSRATKRHNKTLTGMGILLS